MTEIRYADIQHYLTAIKNKAELRTENAPHGVWWEISYQDFTTGEVLGIPIMDTGTPLQSAFYVVLTNGLPELGIPRMPKGGPFIADPGYTTKLADGTVITGDEIAANIKSWLENGFPQ